MRVLAALSGGVDSAVAAALATESGHEVVGVHLALSARPVAFRDGARGCCSLEDARDARRAADVLGVPFYVWDLAARFQAEVVDDFVAEYAAGRTPNPCIRCNQRIKFAALLDRALALGFDAVCTGHYAQLRRGPDGVELHRGADAAKDQSYVLAVLTPGSLAHAMFPVGDLPKARVRDEAARRGLLVADKPDSSDLCFVPSGDTAGFLRDRLGEAPGPIVDAVTGDEVGRHEGAHRFTVGQRRGLGLERPAPDHHRRYVVRVEPATATVLVGPAELLGVDVVSAERPVWCGPAPRGPMRVTAQLRAHGAPVDAVLEPGADGVTTRLAEPERGVAPGQTIAWYDGTRVVGSGTVAATSRRRCRVSPSVVTGATPPAAGAASSR